MDRHRIRFCAGTSSQDVPVRARKWRAEHHWVPLAAMVWGRVLYALLGSHCLSRFVGHLRVVITEGTRRSYGGYATSAAI